MFIVLASVGQKKQNFGSILTFFWAPIPTPFYRWGPNLMYYSRRKVYVYLWNFVSIGLFCRPVAAKNPNFCRFLPIFWTSVISDFAIWHQSQNVEQRCTTTNLPLSNGIKIVSVLQGLHGETERTVCDVQKRDEQTDRQTDKKLNVFGHPYGGWNPSQTKLGMVIEDLERVLAPGKLLGVWRKVSLLGGAENLGETRPPQIKTPIAS